MTSDATIFRVIILASLMSQDQYEKLTNHDEEEQHDMPQPESS